MLGDGTGSRVEHEAAPVTVAAAAPLFLGGHSRAGVASLPAAVLGHALGWLGSSDLGGLAGTSPALRLAAIRHLRSAREVTLDVCIYMFDRGHAAADALRGCAIRGIRLAAAYLSVATHIRRRATSGGTHGSKDAGAVTDVERIDLALATMIARNAETLQSVCLDSTDSLTTLALLANCRRLTAFVIPNNSPYRPEVAGIIRTLVMRNAASLTALCAQPMSAATCALALTSLPLEELHVSIRDAVDLGQLAACSTLQRLHISENDSVPAPSALAAHRSIALALPQLTALRELRVNSLCRRARGQDVWTFAPSLTRLRVEHAFDDTLPLIAGTGVAVLDLSFCDAALVARLVPCFRASLRELKLEFVTTRGADFLATLPAALADCPRLAALRLDDFSTSSRTLMALVAACPLLTELRARVHSSFRAGDLAPVLEALQGRIRELDLYYGPEAENALRNTAEAADAAARDRGEALALRRILRLVLPHLAVLKLHMCTDRLLRKLTCPNLTVLELVGARVRLRRPVPPVAAFPRLERLALRVATVSTRVAPKDDGIHLRVVALSLSWEGAATSSIFYDACDFRAATLAAVLARCPALAKLAFTDRTPAEQIVLALAGSGPSLIYELAIRAPLTAKAPSDKLLAAAGALRTRHPLLSRLDVPCPHAIDPRLARALFPA